MNRREFLAAGGAAAIATRAGVSARENSVRVQLFVATGYIMMPVGTVTNLLINDIPFGTAKCIKAGTDGISTLEASVPQSCWNLILDPKPISLSFRSEPERSNR
jgi:hypothetical protein